MAVEAASERVGVPPWRPVQFLGNKLRSLESISAAVRDLDARSPTVWEPFSGSSVVSQRLAADGHRIWAGDALSSSATIAKAMLGVGRPSQQASPTSAAAVAVEYAETQVAPVWESWVVREQQALSAGDGAHVLAEAQEVPQRWRPDGAGSALTRLFEQSDRSADAGEERAAGLISTTYAGTYFGLAQALTLDGLREGIDIAAPRIGWTRDALLTALCHAASAAVFSPGKHFAQPHRVDIGKDLGFHARRVLQDRGVNIVEEFLRAALRIGQSARPAHEGHVAEHELANNVSASDLRAQKVGVAYVDPPYTAQQYSRFYHLLETLVAGIPPTLQRVNDQVTRGLYPKGRYLSPFSSRRQAPQAFRDLIDVTHSAGASLVLSYSAARGRATGNARMVSLEEIVAWVQDAYGVAAVSIEELNLRYRQFNSSRAEIVGREDPEFLVVGKR